MSDIEAMRGRLSEVGPPLPSELRGFADSQDEIVACIVIRAPLLEVLDEQKKLTSGQN